jgi:ATP-dependent DNA ligase
MPGGSIYEPKWDGYRLVVVHGDELRLWSRNGTDLSDRFPDVVAAAEEQIPRGTVVDGEVVVWADGRLSFDHLQQRLVNRPERVAVLAAAAPASYVAFDLLWLDGRDLRRRPLSDRRRRLTEVASDWAPPLQLSPCTSSRSEAEAWFEAYRPAGVEGLVVKGAATAYQPGQRAWIKVKSRETREVLVGAVIGPADRPEAAVAGLRTSDGELVVVGRTTPLTDDQAGALAQLLAPPRAPHPWPDAIGAGHFGGSRKKVPITHVEPGVVVEVTADSALQAGRFRHPLRFVRPRLDLTEADLPTVDRTSS